MSNNGTTKNFIKISDCDKEKLFKYNIKKVIGQITSPLKYN